jgi:hypothetical protein
MYLLLIIYNKLRQTSIIYNISVSLNVNIVILFTISYCTANNQQIAINIEPELEKKRTSEKKRRQRQ